MKKLIAVLLGLSIACGAFAQGFGSMTSDVDLYVELGDSPFTFQPLSYVFVGMDGIITPSDNLYATNTRPSRNQQFGFNMVELAFHPYSTGTFTLGADVEWNWYHMNRDYMWVPNESNGTRVSVKNKDDAGFKEVKGSILSVCTFSFPLSFNQKVWRFNFNLGATAELNLNGCVQFKGITTDGTVVNEMKGGNRYSKNIATNLFSYNIHAAISYGGLGVYAKYRPKAVLQDSYGPQFQTWTIGLILGLGM